MCCNGPRNQDRWEFSEHCWGECRDAPEQVLLHQPLSSVLIAAKFLKGCSVTTLPTPPPDSALSHLHTFPTNHEMPVVRITSDNVFLVPALLHGPSDLFLLQQVSSPMLAARVHFSSLESSPHIQLLH